MKNLRFWVVTATAALLTACATATPYQPASAPGAFDGFSQTMLENDRARVTFGGNSLTDRETVENYLLYRAAEVAVERGFDHFSLVERDTEAKTRTRVTGNSWGAYDPFFNYNFYNPGYGWSRAHRYSAFYGFGGRRGFGYSGFRGGGFGFGHDPFFNDFDVREITKYRASAEVKFGRGPAPENNSTFDAKEVLQNLGAVISYPEAKG